MKPEESLEQELQIMKERIQRSLGSLKIREKVRNDFTYTFEQLGLSPEEAEEVCNSVFSLLVKDAPLPDVEGEILNIFESIKLKIDDKEQNLIEILHEKLKDRAQRIAKQVLPYLEDVKGSVIDYGAGDGQVTQILHDQLGLDIEGVDIRVYRAPNVTVPITLFNGGRVEVDDGKFEAGLLTNVFHHEKDNEKIINELDRIVKRKLVIIETVADGATEESMEQDRDRTFMNDYLYNRLFHNADVPVPGAYETPKQWIHRFDQHGWKLTYEEDLGFDEPTIKDKHHLLVFEKLK